MELSEMVLVPVLDLMPLTSPAVPEVVLVVAFVRFEIVLPLMVIVPVPALLIPKTFCALLELVEPAWMLLAWEVLPMVLLLIVMVPDVAVLFIPVK